MTINFVFSRQLISEIHQGLMIIQATFGSRADTKAFDKKMTQREKEAGKSFHDTMVVVANILEAFKKLKRISDEIFGNEDVSVSKAKYVV